jgi:superfamily II DNA or RNA helicase
MATSITGTAKSNHDVPDPGQLVVIRDRRWVVTDISRSGLEPDVISHPVGHAQHVVTLASIEEDATGEELRVVWELEPGREVLDRGALPIPNPGKLDDPERLDAFLDAVRWGAIASADPRHLQSPFRSGITIEDYQLDPVVRALRMPRVNLLIADDVGLGKTIEAGLVVQELLLRHRARTVFIVCPASLGVKWKTEMAEKFGLEFRIVNRELLGYLRRTRGLYANPFVHFPRLIISIDYLKRDHVMRRMKEVLPGRPEYPRAFDLLIVDEAHGVAPSGRGRYATDSLRTRTIRTIAPHFEHRLFVTATPHNGYKESFSALLELLDDRRFARGVPWNEEQLRRVMVRRLKSQLQGFPKREILPLEVAWNRHEREAYEALKKYGDLRLAMVDQAGDKAASLADRFVITLLKKRLFSSPAAFAETLAVHRGTVSTGTRDKARKPLVSVLQRAVDEVDVEHGDEEDQREATTTALGIAAEASPGLTDEQRRLLDQLEGWAGHAKGKADSKVEALIQWLNDVVRPRGEEGQRRWNDERVIIFTEYRDTQRWLHEQLAARGLAGDRLALLYGGMEEQERERIKAQFQASPDLSPVRILLATDAASEGIDLQLQCYRLVHYEIPWNPNRLEQRNGRVDRHGQPSSEVLIYHFVSAGYGETKPGSLDGDLVFLYAATKKVEVIREDLGSVGPVIAQQVEEAMLGRRQKIDTIEAEKRAISRKVLKIERDLGTEIARLRERLDETVRDLAITPERVERGVRVALELARQPQPVARMLRRKDGTTVRVFDLPPLAGSWARCSESLPHPLTGRIRPITFDHDVWDGHDDVVLVHLQHRLVQQSLRLLRSEIWATDTAARLARVTTLTVPTAALSEPAVIAHGRLVVTGNDGHRLHEEVISAGGQLVEDRLRRMSASEVETALAISTSGAVDPSAQRALAAGWDRYAGSLLAVLEVRARDRAESLNKVLRERAEEEVANITHVLEDLGRTIEAQLKEPEPEQLALSFTLEEQEQFSRDVEALHRRLQRIPSDIAEEVAAIRRRYADPEPRLFPVAVTFLVPDRWTP